MKRILLSIAFITGTIFSSAQNLSVDLKRNWYAAVPTIDISMVDSMMLYPLRGNPPATGDLFLWNYVGGNDYKLSIYNRSQPEIRDPYVFAPELWRVVEKYDTALYLTVRDHKDPRLFHKKLGKYRLYLYRDELNILHKVLMVREYQHRTTQRIYAPPVNVLKPSAIEPVPNTTRSKKGRRK